MSGMISDDHHKGHHDDFRDANLSTHLELQGLTSSRTSSLQRNHSPCPSPRSSPWLPPQSSIDDKHTDYYYDTKKATEPVQLEVPGQEVGRVASTGRNKPLRSCLSPHLDHKCKQEAKVRWDSGVVFNDHKVQSRPRKSNLSDKSSKSQDRPFKHPTSARFATANTSAKMDPVNSRQPSFHLSPAQHSSSRVHLHDFRGGAFQTSTQRANISSKKVSSPKRGSIDKFKEALPAVPDPPRDPRRPPPAPRPARLPSPDLPEIDPRKFYLPMEMYHNSKYWEGDLKMDSAQEKVDAQCMYDFEQ